MILNKENTLFLAMMTSSGNDVYTDCLQLIDAGANKVIHIEAVHSIEDWFLYDLEGILRFLKLNNKIKVSGNNGYDKLQRLYKKANKIYIKGMNSNGMVACLDLDKITKNIHGQLDPLYKALGVRKN